MEKMDKDLSNKVEDFRKKVTQASEEIVFRSFPNKILELTDLIETTRNPDSPFHSSNVTHSTDTTVYPPASEASPVEAPQSKKRKLENGATNYDTIVQSNVQSSPFTGRVLSNKHLVEKVHGVVKKEAEELAAFVDKVKLWVTLTLPNILVSGITFPKTSAAASLLFLASRVVYTRGYVSGDHRKRISILYHLNTLSVLGACLLVNVRS
ncbi:Proteasome activator complex subunit 3 [Leucoagaricus sp. SymC.cos]|nr:Proteasome activator complex subunit 3 [Leucoagaricus sp. SymC.cos]